MTKRAYSCDCNPPCPLNPCDAYTAGHHAAVTTLTYWISEQPIDTTITELLGSIIEGAPWNES